MVDRRPAPSLDGPEGVAVDAAGDLFIADTYNNEIREVHAGTGVITTIVGAPPLGGPPADGISLNEPYGVAVDAHGNLFIANTLGYAILEVNASTGAITTVAGNGTLGYTGDGGPATSAELNAPQGVAVDALGNIFIADYENNVVREVNASTGMITTVAGNGTLGSTGDGGPATSAEPPPSQRRGGQ